MSKYKVLSLPTILDTKDKEDFEFFTDDWLDRREEIEPIFNRLGAYLDRKKNIYWVETKFGCWILGDKNDFQNELEYQTSDEYILSKEVITSFRILEKHRLLSKELHMRWYQHTNATMLRDTRRGVSKWVKELKEE
jgi:hypothetical protein